MPSAKAAAVAFLLSRFLHESTKRFLSTRWTFESDNIHFTDNRKYTFLHAAFLITAIVSLDTFSSLSALCAHEQPTVAERDVRVCSWFPMNFPKSCFQFHFECEHSLRAPTFRHRSIRFGITFFFVCAKWFIVFGAIFHSNESYSSNSNNFENIFIFCNKWQLNICFFFCLVRPPFDWPSISRWGIVFIPSWTHASISENSRKSFSISYFHLSLYEGRTGLPSVLRTHTSTSVTIYSILKSKVWRVPNYMRLLSLALYFPIAFARNTKLKQTNSLRTNGANFLLNKSSGNWHANIGRLMP